VLVQETLALTRPCLFSCSSVPRPIAGDYSACYVAGFVLGACSKMPQGLLVIVDYGQFLGAGVIVLLLERNAGFARRRGLAESLAG